jgi:hypothetical protein
MRLMSRKPHALLLRCTYGLKNTAGDENLKPLYVSVHDAYGRSALRLPARLVASRVRGRTGRSSLALLRRRKYRIAINSIPGVSLKTLAIVLYRRDPSTRIARFGQ